MKIVKLSLSLMVGLSLLGCDDIKEYTSSEAGQNFERKSPEVEQPKVEAPKPTTSSSSSSSNNDTSTPSLAVTGVVWKPVSEGDGKLVVLTPTSFGTPTVTILNRSGQFSELGHYIRHTNGNRATYRFNKPGRGYDKPSYLKIDDKVYLIADPAKRVN